jgi:predicted anti-sigma-YlaC factor YlaD
MICSIVKYMVSRALDSGRPLPPFVKGHIERCSGCRGFVAAANTLEVRLASDAAVLARKPSFEKARPARAPVYALRFAAAAACLLVAAGLLYMRTGAVQRNADVSGNGVVLSQVVLNDGISAWLATSGIFEDTVTGSQQTGLGREMSYLAQDLASAARFLADSVSLPL